MEIGHSIPDTPIQICTNLFDHAATQNYSSVYVTVAAIVFFHVFQFSAHVNVKTDTDVIQFGS
jgi:hypothetical protein